VVPGGAGGRIVDSYTPLLFVIPLALMIPAMMMMLTAVLGPKKPSAGKMVPYESGILPQTSAEQRFPVRFYLVAVSFLLFDVEAVFLFPWAVRFRQLGWYGFLAAMLFLVVLLIGLIYEWRKGGLDWK
jgi:NADH-quinone oxidoreductase subunit A